MVGIRMWKETRYAQAGSETATFRFYCISRFVTSYLGCMLNTPIYVYKACAFEIRVTRSAGMTFVLSLAVPVG